MTEPHDTALERAIEWLDTHINYEKMGGSGRGPSLDHDPEHRLRHLGRYMELMDEPQHKYPTIHLTGTNGKTSTARILTTLMLAQGLRAGTYTSPHLERLSERILVNEEPIGDDELAEVLQACAALEPMMGGDNPSYFEILTAAAYRHFADSPVDIGIIEVGVGGKYDATNIIDSTVSVVTNIGLDHQAYLGETREDIAWHKAGIVRKGSTLVIGETNPRLMPIFEAQEPGKILLAGRDLEVTSNEVAVGGRMISLRTPMAEYEDVFLSLHGSFQADNAILALNAAEAFFEAPLSDEVVRRALGSVRSPGRMEVVQRRPLVLIDGAHNDEGFSALAAGLREDFATVEGQIFVVGQLEPHRIEGFLEAVDKQKVGCLIAATAPSPRAVPAAEIAEQAKAAGVPAVVTQDPTEAVHQAIQMAGDDDMVLVTGSLWFAGAVRSSISTDT